MRASLYHGCGSALLIHEAPDANGPAHRLFGCSKRGLLKAQSMAEVTTRVFLDRIQGDYGVVVTDDGRSLDVPLALLPEGICAGVALTVTVAIDERSTAEGRSQVTSLMEALLSRGDA